MGFFKNKRILYIFYGLLFLVGLVFTMIASQSNQDTRSKAAVPAVQVNTPTPTVKSSTVQTIEGTLRIVHEDRFKENKSINRYFVDTSQSGTVKSVQFEYSGSQKLVPGSKISITYPATAKTASGVLKISDTETGGTLKIVSQASTASGLSTGTNKVAIFLINWSDFTSASPTYVGPKDKNETEAIFDQVEDFIRSESYGKLNLINEVADIYGPYTMLNVPISCLTFSDGNFFNTIDQAVKNTGVDFSQYQQIVELVSMPDDYSKFPCSRGGIASFGTNLTLLKQFARLSSVIYTPNAVEHEFGHNYSGWHSADLFNCSYNYTGCTYTEYGSWEPMGICIGGTCLYKIPVHANNFSAYHKEKFGWNTLTNNKWINTSGTYTVSSLENSPSGVQNLQICRDSYSFYSVEYRTNTGYDANLPANAVSGPLIKIVGTNPSFFPLTLFSQSDIILVSGGTVPGALEVGKTFTDQEKGISITAQSKTPTSATVNVNYSVPPLFCPPPTVPGTASTQQNVMLLSPPDNFIYHANDPAMTFSWTPGNLNPPVNYQLEMLTTETTYPGYFRCSQCTSRYCSSCFYPQTAEQYSFSGCNNPPDIYWRVNIKDSANTITHTGWRKIQCLPQITGTPTPTPAPAGPGANVSVQLGKDPAVYLPTIPDKSAVAVNYPKDGGPVIIKSTNNTPIIVGIRERWKLNGVAKSTFQLMGLPESQRSDKYYFPAYNNKTLSGQLRVANIDNYYPKTTVGITIGNTLPQPFFDLVPFESKRVTYDVDSGPVKIDSDHSYIIAALRDAWLVNGQTTSFTELMGLPYGSLSDTYYFPAYNNITLSGQLRIANVDPSLTTIVTVSIGGINRGTYSLAPKQSVRPTFALDAGPVVVRSSNGAKIIAALRDAWLVNGQAVSFSQMMGLPKEQIADTYYFPWYENTNTVSGQLRIGNIGSTATDVTVKIAGAEMGKYTIQPNASVRPVYANLNKGPIEVKSSNGVKIIAAIRDALISSTGTVTSFTQTMGLPSRQLSTTYYLPAYNNVTLDTELRIANP